MSPRRRLTAPGFLITVAAVLAAALVSPPPASARPPAPPAPAASEFHFVVLGDSQFHDPTGFNRMIDSVRLVYPAFAIQVGDMIEGYADLETIERQWQRFQRQVAPLAPVPFLPVPGNHDLYNAQRHSDPSLEALYERVWGASYYDFDYGNSRFIVLNTDVPGAERSITGAQLGWLERELDGNRAEHVFLFMHRPPATLTDAEALHALLTRYPVRYVFYGHLHHYHFRERDGIRYVMTNSTADSALAEEAVGSFDHFLLVSVRDDAVSMAVIRQGGIVAPDYVDPDDNYDAFELSRKLAPATVTLAELGEGTYRMALPLANPIARPVTVYVSCDSDDGRWRFEPAAVDPLPLEPTSQTTLELTVRHEPEQPPESLPECALRVPFRKRDGQWLEFTFEVSGSPTSSAAATTAPDQP